MTLSTDAVKIKDKKAGQRACDEKDEKGKLCVGHLKRWAAPTAEAIQAAGTSDLYRCERCHAIYRPLPEDRSSAGLKYEERPVNVLGDFGR
jgi:hypothetical protein